MPSLAPIFGKLSFSGINIGQFIIVVFAFLFVDIFDTLGTLIGVRQRLVCLIRKESFRKLKEH